MSSSVQIVLQKSDICQHNTLQVNRLIKFISSKGSPSLNKLKQILNSQPLLNQPFNPITKKTISMNTRNIFVGRNKTEVSSPREQIDQKFQVLSKNHFDQKFDKSKLESNLFPKLNIPKLTDRYDTKDNTKWLNNQIGTSRHKKNISSHQKSDSKMIFDKHQRERYNLSLKKLIQKAFRNKQKHNNQYKPIKYEQQIQNPYASKGKLTSKSLLTKKAKNRLSNQQSSQVTNRLNCSSRLLQIQSPLLPTKPLFNSKQQTSTLKLIHQLQEKIINPQERQVKVIGIKQRAEGKIKQRSVKTQHIKQEHQHIKQENQHIKDENQHIKQQTHKKPNNKKNIKQNNKAKANYLIDGYEWHKDTIRGDDTNQLDYYVKKQIHKNSSINTQIDK